jgi:hypothetical protein
MSRQDDDRIVREMLAPNVEESLEALEFWLRRHAGLPIYRRAARAEARRMIDYWQARSLSDAPRAPLAAIANARSVVGVARLCAAYRIRRFGHRAAVTGLLFTALIALAAGR